MKHAKEQFAKVDGEHYKSIAGELYIDFIEREYPDAEEATLITAVMIDLNNPQTSADMYPTW